jgi:hypothetical protein
MIYIPYSRCDIDNMHMQARALSLPQTQKRLDISLPLLYNFCMPTISKPYKKQCSCAGTYEALMLYTLEYL